MSSSGTLVQEFVFSAECGDENDNGDVCSFAGDVDAWEDPELSAWGWTCPSCGVQHEEDGQLDGDVDFEEFESWLHD